MDARSISVWIANRIGQEVSGRISAAATRLNQLIRDVLNVQAPTRTVVSNVGQAYKVAITKAKKGAPPRKVTGLGRAGLSVRVEDKTRIVVFNAARSIRGFPYMDYHEANVHKFIVPTFKKHKKELETVAGVRLKNMRVKH